jgi:hypothetical protein
VPLGNAHDSCDDGMAPLKQLAKEHGWQQCPGMWSNAGFGI